MRKLTINGALAGLGLGLISLLSLGTYWLKMDKKPTSVKTKPAPTFMEVPNFVREDVNNIQYPEQLKRFKKKMAALANGERKQVRILHIGDSHIQAGHNARRFMQLIQAEYGNAGRGLVFPYQVAKTNSPDDLRSSSPSAWEVCKNVMHGTHTIPVGITGMSLRTQDPHFKLQVGTREGVGAFDRVTIFGPRGSQIFDLGLYEGWEADEDAPSHYVLMDTESAKRTATIQLHKPQSAITLQARPSAGKREFILQGLLLENTRETGVLYSAVGVNGAMYASYNGSEDFFAEVAALKPDLVIISLGTNEAYAPAFAADYFEKNIHEMLSRLRKEGQCQDILITTPNDLGAPGRRVKGKVVSSGSNRNGYYASEILISKAKEHGAAVWDFYEVMGGYGSIQRWTQYKLAQGDRIHLTPQGYQLQAELLYKALRKELD